MSLGGQLREIRRMRGFTQEELAEKSGILQSLISKIERGSSDGSIDSISLTASALGYELVLCPRDDQITQGPAELDEVGMLEAYRRLNADEKQAVRRHAIALARLKEIERIMK